MTQQEFIEAFSKRFTPGPRLLFYDKFEKAPEFRNGTPVPGLLLELIVFGYFQREIIRIGCRSVNPQYIGTRLQIDRYQLSFRKEVLPHFNDSLYSYCGGKTVYKGEFQQINGPEGEIDFDMLEHILRDNTELANYPNLFYTKN